MKKADIINLRVGSLVCYKKKLVARLTLDDFSEMKHNLLSLIEPIPLTEEWIKKLGFIKKDNYFFKSWGKNGVEFIFDYKRYNGFEYQLGKSKYKLIKNVHQLQNLYLALTGEDLNYEIKM